VPDLRLLALQDLRRWDQEGRLRGLRQACRAVCLRQGQSQEV